MRFLAVLLITGVGFMAAALPQSSKPNKPQRDSAQSKEATLEGCVDQQGETYVLRSIADMTKWTTLKGKSFSDDNFARFIGRKVSVRGTLAEGILKVTSIEKIAETCSS
jgi:hypothetical protein